MTMKCLSGIHPCPYRIGDIILTDIAENPAVMYKGTKWEMTCVGRVPVGMMSTDSDFKTINSIGGSKTQNLTVKNLPNVTGRLEFHNAGVATNLFGASGSFSPGNRCSRYGNLAGTNAGAISIGIVNFSLGGENLAHNNMQPYQVKYFWIRKS
ncbi:hypothetical protein GSF08_09705 [Clostridiaceae bacterium DONG20-135]|uniref:Baseplate structural protein Gp10 C-terminal domain-containing protein n=1 Tax=Copranaerobaculum intestinale TaxID=2692629 RepID=A0A6N8U8N5_9FIRM|nr:hypothetical protein [Copranaerobaculum intestinale]MXQ74210.1 hypothetical protein [Copranaerobaculum intestinale]